MKKIEKLSVGIALATGSLSGCTISSEQSGLEGDILNCISVENLYHDGANVVTGESSGTNKSTHEEVGRLVAAVQAEASQYEFKNPSFRYQEMDLAIIDPTSDEGAEDIADEPGELACFSGNTVYLTPAGMAVKAALENQE
jgi:hypothetical protein